MSECFEFVIYIYDGHGEKQYYGTGELIKNNDFVEGYVCNDYLLIKPKDSFYSFLFCNSDSEILISTEIRGLKLNFPRKYRIQFSNSADVSKIELEVGSAINDEGRCKKVQNTLEEVKSYIKFNR